MVATELGSQIRPDIETLEELRLQYGAALDESRRLTEKFSSSTSSAGLLALRCAIAQATLLRPVLSQSDIAQSPLLRPIGKSEGNPPAVIDIAGGELIRAVVTSSVEDTGQIARIRIEEMKEWEDITPTHQVRSDQGDHLLLIDPIDETDGIKKGNRAQSIGILVAGKDGSFSAASVTSLVPGDRRMLVIDGTTVHRLFYNERSHSINTAHLTIPSPWKEGDRLRIATLPRRLDTLKQTLLFKEYSDRIDIQPTFGGFALLDMIMPIRKQTHVMVDLKKGQPWYEPWAWIAQQTASQTGLIVRGKHGNTLPLDRVFRFIYEKDGNARIPQAIYVTPEVFDFVGPRLTRFSIPTAA
jgi:hypothetical protein